ncbi:MAG TPA: RluA family pseudouridine synthase [Phycisphaerales bacterium]|nr:RluA family pseudouridine synthase [Phycisphaerales bacterium]
MPSNVQPQQMTSTLIPIIHQDDRIIVLNKPSGLLSVPGIGPEKADCLASRIAAVHPGARIVHRLDRDTSGVIIMAFDADAHRELSRQFHDREVEKTYLAIVAGEPAADEGTIDLPMRKDMEAGSTPMQVIDHVQGRRAVTYWRVIERCGDRTRVELRPVTGRSHQLRLHMKCLGHPILGDDLYAPEPLQRMADRLCLHAHTLSITHPSTGAPMTFIAPAPF